jgi:integrase
MSWIGPPKTDTSKRVVVVLLDYREHLEAARLLAAGLDADAVIFGRAHRGGGLVDHTTTLRHWLYPAQDAAGLPRSGWHALRRSYALMLDARKVTPIDSRDLLGHADVRLTQGTYQQDAGQARVDRLRRAVEGS